MEQRAAQPAVPRAPRAAPVLRKHVDVGVKLDELKAALQAAHAVGKGTEAEDNANFFLERAIYGCAMWWKIKK